MFDYHPGCMTQKLSEIQRFHRLPEGRRPKTEGVQLVLQLLDAQGQLQPANCDGLTGLRLGRLASTNKLNSDFQGLC